MQEIEAFKHWSKERKRLKEQGQTKKYNPVKAMEWYLKKTETTKVSDFNKLHDLI